MPISSKEFQEGNFTVLRGRAFEVLEFLKRNKDKAYISKEIADAVKSSPVAVTPILKKLVDGGFVDKKAPYYTYTISNNDKKAVKEEESKSIEVEPVEPYEGEDAESEPFDEPQQ